MIHILDHQHDQIIDTLQNKANAQPFFDDTHTATIKNEEHFHFSTPYDGSGHLTARNRIVIPDEDGHYREFIIDETVKAGTIKEVYTRASFRELKKQKVITPRTLDGQTVDTALDFTLDGTEWKRGITEFGGSRSFTIEQHTN
ncbi:hypothetical protein P4U41_17545, partial [Alkalihalophilus marmarensis]|nr:hypothetical protein [Alkalihalophilus marmarensis]